MPETKTTKLIGRLAVARDFDVNCRTLDRWSADEALGFPTPVKIKDRIYYDSAALEAWKAEQLRRAVAARGADPRKGRAESIVRARRVRAKQAAERREREPA